MIEIDFDFNRQIASVNDLLAIEKAAGRKINGLEAIEEHRRRHDEIRHQWNEIQAQLKPITNRIEVLPILPSQEIIEWAQSVKAMDSLRFLEVDTSGIGDNDKIVRITLANQYGKPLFDQLIHPESAQMSEKASLRNGLTDDMLADAPALVEVWPRIQRAFRGAYILAFNLEWDIKTLKTAAEQHGVAPLPIIGECLQRRCTAYYRKEYYLDLPKVAERMGHSLERWDAPFRLSTQYAILDGMSHGITDVNVPKELVYQEPVNIANTNNDPDDGLSDLDDHPF